MIYDVIKPINIPARAMRWAVGDTVTTAKLGEALIASLLEEGALKAPAGAPDVPVVEPEPAYEPEPQSAVPDEMEPEAEPLAEAAPDEAEEEDDDG